MRKRGNIFLLEFLFGAIVLLGFFIYILPYLRPVVPVGDIVGNYADQSIELLKSSPVSNFNQETIDFIPDQYKCFDCTMAEQLSILMINGQLTEASDVANSTLFFFIPSNFGYNIFLEGQGIEETVEVQSSNLQNNFFVGSTLVTGLNDTTTDIYVFGVTVWG